MPLRILWLAPILVAVGLPVSGCGGAPRDELVVYAAASLREVVAELGGEFEEETGARLVFNFAGSNVLAQQVAAVEQAEVFLSADLQWIEFLEARGRTVAGSKRSFLRNRIVVIGHEEGGLAMESAEDLGRADFEHLAVANTEAVPAGRYARRWLEEVPFQDGTLWDLLEPRVTPALDVRAALALVESDPRIVGIVYASDVRSGSKVRVLLEPPREEQPDILYGAVQIEKSGAGDLADAFLAYLLDPAREDLYRRHGFERVP